MSSTIGLDGPAAASLRRNEVKPLRNLARPAEAERVLSVEDLKNGGSLNLGGLLEGDGRPLRQRTEGPKAAAARQSRSAGLSLPERLKKLAQIKKSATDYEAIFVDQLVKLMRPSPLTHTPGEDTFSDIAEQPFRDFLSRAGGLGLANAIVGQVARQEGLEQTLQEYPEVMGPSWRPTIPRNLMRQSGGSLALAEAGRPGAGPDRGEDGQKLPSSDQSAGGFDPNGP